MRRITTFAAVLLVFGLLSVPAQATYLTMTKIGEGTVTPSIGANNFSWFSRVTIRATPAPGWVFDRWEGSLRGRPNPYTFYLTSDQTASAIFRPQTPTSSNALVRYVGKADASTSHTVIDTDTHFGWDGWEMSLNSQTWRSTADVDRPLWQHDLTMAVPWFSGDDCIFLVNGGSNPLKYPSPDSTIALVAIALGVKFAQLDQVPNQPLYFTDEVNNERTEDEILAYSLDKYLDTGDYQWPVHSAMVKSVVKAMDVIQLQRKEIDDFFVIGASKRGWTTWLSAAVDPRIKYFLPIVIDVLNFPDQVEHHWESYGSYSPAIQDYVDFDLFCRVDSDPRANDLLNIVDPYRYISRYTHPKFIVNASGDQFFLPDSSRYYFHDLPNPAQTYLRYFPNKDHYMEGVLDDTNNITALLQWAQNVMNGTANPQYSWTIDQNGALVVQTSSNPSSVKLWQATNPNGRDFRLETVGPIYTSSTLNPSSPGVYVGYCPPPAQGFTAFFVELTFGSQVYTTEIVVTPDYDPFDGQGCWQ